MIALRETAKVGVAPGTYTVNLGLGAPYLSEDSFCPVDPINDGTWPPIVTTGPMPGAQPLPVNPYGTTSKLQGTSSTGVAITVGLFALAGVLFWALFPRH